MHGGRYAGNYGNVIWIGEAWHRTHSDRGEAFRHQPLEVGKDALSQTCLYIGWITAVDEDYHHRCLRPLIALAVHLDLLQMIPRGEFEAWEQHSQAGIGCKGEYSSHCRALVGLTSIQRRKREANVLPINSIFCNQSFCSSPRSGQQHQAQGGGEAGTLGGHSKWFKPM